MPMVFTVSGIAIFVSDVQPWKALLSMLRTVAVTYTLFTVRYTGASSVPSLYSTQSAVHPTSNGTAVLTQPGSASVMDACHS